jgi:hypothetical protein
LAVLFCDALPCGAMDPVTRCLATQRF